MELDFSAKRNRSLIVLQRLDKNVLEIIAEASIVSMYKLMKETSSWNKMNVEGSAFITRSISAPYYMLFVLNKASPDNFVLDLSTVMKAVLKDTSILMKCSDNDGEISYSMWISLDEERPVMLDNILKYKQNDNGELPKATISPRLLAKINSNSVGANDTGSISDATPALKALLDNLSVSSSVNTVKNDEEIVNNSTHGVVFTPEEEYYLGIISSIGGTSKGVLQTQQLINNTGKDVPISFIRKVIKDNILGLNSGVTEYEKYELYKRVSAQTPAGEFLTDKEIGSKSKSKNIDEVGSPIPSQVDESSLNSIFSNIKIHKSATTSVSPVNIGVAPVVVTTPVISGSENGGSHIESSPKLSSMISPSDLLGTEKKKFYVKK